MSFVCFSTASIYMMQQLSRDYYYLHWLWLASIFITFFLDHLLFDPIMSAIFGNTSFYRMRGYYYDYEMPQAFK